MRKIQDLKQNECIHIRTKKEGRKIKELAGSVYVFPEEGFYYHHQGPNTGPLWLEKPLPGSIVHPASDYVTTKLDLNVEIEILKRDRIAKLEKEVADLKKISIKESCAPWYQQSGRGIRDYQKKLVDFAAKNPDLNFTPDFDKVEPVKKDLEVGKWYRSNKNDALVFLHATDSFDCFGFDPYGNWTTRIFSPKMESNWRHACEDEVFKSLSYEAMARGYDEGAVVGFENTFKMHLDELYGYEFEEKENQLWLWYTCNGGEKRVLIFDNGKWAEIIEQSKPKEECCGRCIEKLDECIHDSSDEGEKEIDWSVSGQIVETSNNCVVITSGRHQGSTFEGTPLIHNFVKLGLQSFDWGKRFFKLRTEPLTIQNPSK